MLIMFKKLLNIGKSNHNHHHRPSSTATASEKPTSSSTSVLTVDDPNGSNASESIIVRTNGTSTPATNVTLNGSDVHQFVRTAQNRMSLPIMQHNNRMRRQAYSHIQRRGQQISPPRSLGHVYLQHKGETKQACLPDELTTIDTIRALFVCAFPHLLTMEFMSQPFVKIYIYNPNCNIFYELCDIEDVKHESVLRIHQSDPIALSMAPMSLQMHHSAQAMPHEVSMNNMQSHYATLGRMMPSRPLPPQVPAPPPPQHQAQMPPHLMQPAPPMMNSTFQQRLTPHQNANGHHQTQSFNHLPQVPPPKPRRMIPANYSMHRIDPPSQ